MKMKKNLNTATINEVYTLLDTAKYAKMEAADRRALVKAMRPLKKVTADFNDFREDAIKRMRPDNYQEVAGMVDKLGGMTAEARAVAMAEPKYAEAVKAFNAFQNDMSECLKEELTKEHELEFEPLSPEAIDRLLDSNPDWTAGKAMLVEDALGE